MDPSSIPDCMGKMAGRERYMWGIYQSILNCRYRNDKIQIDWIKYGFPIGKKENAFFRDRDSNGYLINKRVPV